MNSVAIFIRLAIVASQNVRNPANFSENSNLSQFKVIDLVVNRKCACNVLL